jgi:hypothetical protein
MTENENKIQDIYCPECGNATQAYIEECPMCGTSSRYFTSVRKNQDLGVVEMKLKKSSLTTPTLIQATLGNLGTLLVEKNKKYGNSALEPIGIFSKHDSANSICIRLDDKLSRVKNSSELRKNDVCDLMGYLTLLCVAHGWTDFKEFND